MKQISLKPSGRLITLALMPESEGQKQLLLDHQTVIITGAAKGIGRGIGIVMAQEGADIVLADIDEEGMGETERMITAIGRTCLNVRADVQDIEQGHRLVKATLQQFGKIDILVNNAGINTPGAIQIRALPVHFLHVPRR